MAQRWTILRYVPGNAPKVVEDDIELVTADHVKEYIVDQYLHDDSDGTWYTAVSLNSFTSPFSWQVTLHKKLG